jgi:hypothetical protein
MGCFQDPFASLDTTAAEHEERVRQKPNCRCRAALHKAVSVIVLQHPPFSVLAHCAAICSLEREEGAFLQLQFFNCKASTNRLLAGSIPVS